MEKNNKGLMVLIGILSLLVVGLGGVGSIACESLVRSGIHNIDLIDFDKYEESNLNRGI